MNDKVAYIAIDPGETTGWAKFDENGEIIAWGQFKQAEQNKWFDDNIKDIKAVICEDYRNYGHKQQKKWSRNQTSKNIGSLEMVCEMRGIPIHLQMAMHYPIGLKYAGLGELPKNHSISHQYVAIAHGTYWLRTNGILKPTIPGE